MSVSDDISSLTLACPLCNSQAFFFTKSKHKQIYFRCDHCKSVFMRPDDYVNSDDEQKRYETHNNDVTDQRYQKFVSPITKTIENNFSEHDQGLDYGCGTGPVVTYVLNQKGYKNIKLYDPFFHDKPEVLENQYDFIICCEVMEHFYNPKAEFKALRQMLKPNGQLLCKTSLFLKKNNQKDFENWHYKDDETHVFFYSEKSLEYIKNEMNFKSVEYGQKLIRFIL